MRVSFLKIMERDQVASHLLRPGTYVDCSDALSADDVGATIRALSG